ncbi:paraneoplastic antigen Ma2-like [Neoarius graeffei]|uniref:paraneoplastic antigen Ma2-like n=1 Tax=Neoarius graeffei TaxID=443677 RepID=UPI00298D4293|nr:paraneoplastic antigen Ma2-like [Neoarius graeffei]
METRISNSELVNKLKQWCRGEGLDETHSLMVLVPEGVEVAQIETTMETIKALGEKVDSSKVPSEVMPEGDTEAWNLVMVSEDVDVVEEPQGAPVEGSGQAAPGSSLESIIHVVGDLLAKMEKPSGGNSSYHRLRLFLGTLPTPVGEEALEHWLEHAHLMVEESDCSSKEKRWCIMESLKGPALAMVKAVRDTDSKVSPEQCLEAIESAFGSAETGKDLCFAFRLLQQQPKEKLSDFLRWLELSLTRVVRRGGLPPDQAERARVKQLLRSAVHSDMMLVQLKLRERRERPPSFLQHLSKICSKEEYESAWRKQLICVTGPCKR